MSSSSTAHENKEKALAALRNRKQAKSQSLGASSSSSSANPAHGGRYPPQPAQSRDATVSSRFFPPSTPSSYGNVLVPNSSPEQPYIQDNGPNGYRPPQPTPALSAHVNIHAGRAPGFNLFGNDPLSAPTNFITGSSFNNGALRRQRPVEAVASSLEEPPRKKQFRGPVQDALDLSDVPSSPEVQRAAPRRRVASQSTSMSISDDESVVDAASVVSDAAGSSRSRFVRERPAPVSSANSVVSTPSNDPGYQLFKMTYPMEPESRVRAAWTQAGGDKTKAASFLDNPSWAPPKPPTPSAHVDRETGRVREIEEANKLQRAAVREKGKKSLIYANRPMLETTTSTPAASKTAPTDAMSPASPATPFVPAAGRKIKRTKKLVLDSESEADDSDSEDQREAKKSRIETSFESRALNYFNNRDSAELQELTGCTAAQAELIISKRPFESKEAFFESLGQGRKKAGPAGISPRIFEDVVETFKGYGSVDSILEDCERIGDSLRAAIESWSTVDTKEQAKTALLQEEAEDGALSLRMLSKISEKKPKGLLTKQPSLLAKGIELKDYQLVGVNWLNLLYRREYSCILADEMGLGKTIQVISFLAHLKEQGNRGPHLIVVPSSTLENWMREFTKFAPGIKVVTYYGDKDDRPALRATLRTVLASPNKWEVLITTYTLAQSEGLDRKFFKEIEWECTIFDEGHVLKNYQSQRYQALLKFDTRWRLLLTGTPLQNNLQELVSLMNFILPNQFTDQFKSLQTIFKAKGNANVSLLSQERISRAKKMMTPFVLRRRKDQVLKDLPNKNERIEWCELSELQQTIYNDALERSKKTILEADLNTPDTGTPNGTGTKPPAKKKAQPKNKTYVENSSNVLMDLRKAASHPMLFRTLFTMDNLKAMGKQLLKEPDFIKRGALLDVVVEDMTVMTDAELQLMCSTYKCLRKFLKDENMYLNAGKVKVLLDLIARYRKEDRKVLVFSQFTQVLDILQVVLRNKGIKFLVLTGSTRVDVRQSLVDEFTEDDSIPVFLLSTKAGGMGINLTAASVVVMFDQDFNPHNDKQAHDRAYRIGQKRDVDVVKLITRGTIEEDILKLGATKLALDEAVAGDVDGKESKQETAQEKEMKTSLMKVLRRQLEREDEEKAVEKTTSTS